jgi:imidazolonepropionase-like amidohydrolase
MNRCFIQKGTAFLSMLLLVSITIALPAQTKRIRPAGEHLIFKCKALINPGSEEVLEGAAIEVNNGKILRVVKANDPGLPKDVKVIDYSDKYIIPGLIDAHGHLYGGLTYRHTTSDMLPIFYLAAGVTSVQSPGSMDPGSDIAMRNRIDDGVLPGPRYFLSGEYLEMDPVSVRWMESLKTPEEARLKVDRWIAQGATSVKIYHRMQGDILRAAIDEAHAHGVRVYGHIGAVTYKEAIEMGIDELFHGFYALPDVRPSGIDPAQEPAKFAQAMNEADFGQPKIQEMLKLAAASKVVFTPTVIVVEPLDMVKDHLEEQKKYFTSDAWQMIEKRMQAPGQEQAAIRVQKNKEFIKAAYDAGVILATGTDLTMVTVLPGYSLWREMKIFAEAGLKPMSILKAATVNGAFVIGRSDLLGSIEGGKLADFVVLNEDPTEDIDHVRSVHRVVKSGVIYDPEELLKPLVGKFH